jgi:hypothetical protein
MLGRVALLRTVTSEEYVASIIWVTIDELGTTSAVTSNRSRLPFLQKPHFVTSQKAAFFTVTAAKTSNIT